MAAFLRRNWNTGTIGSRQLLLFCWIFFGLFSRSFCSIDLILLERDESFQRHIPSAENPNWRRFSPCGNRALLKTPTEPAAQVGPIPGNATHKHSKDAGSGPSKTLTSPAPITLAREFLEIRPAIPTMRPTGS